MNEQQNTHNFYDDKINLADLIGVLIKRKWLILGGSLICAFTVGFLTFLSPRQYQSNSLILVSPSIVKNNNNGYESAQVSEVMVSSLEASTYEVLAKSDELMLALADTLASLLSPDDLQKISSEPDNYNLATTLITDLGVELLQAGGSANIQSATPLLVLSYKSADPALPPVVINSWSKLFLQRNQGLSSSVTNEFYQNVVGQYEQIKNKLESKEDELRKVNAASNELNRLRTEIGFKSAQLDTSLKAYQKLQTDLEQKTQEYEFVNNHLKTIENEGLWIGHLKASNLTPLALQHDLVEIVQNIDSLSKDSVSTTLEFEEKLLELQSNHQLKRLSFELETDFSSNRLQLIVVDSLLSSYREEVSVSAQEIRSRTIKDLVFSEEIRSTSPVLITYKAIGDESLWNQFKDNGEFDTNTQNKLQRYRLSSEEINPIYLALLDSMTQNDLNLKQTSSRREFLLTAIDSLEALSTKKHKLLNTLRKEELRLNQVIEQEKRLLNQDKKRQLSRIEIRLLVNRNSYDNYEREYKELKSDQATLRSELYQLRISTKYYAKNYASWRAQLNDLSNQVDSLDLERRRIERDVEVYQESFNRFARLQEEARIARQQAAGDIQIVSSSAVVTPIPRNTMRKALICLAMCLLGFSILSILGEAYYKQRHDNK